MSGAHALSGGAGTPSGGPARRAHERGGPNVRDIGHGLGLAKARSVMWVRCESCSWRRQRSVRVARIT